MAALPEPVSQLISALNKLPGIGPRSAERIALHLLQSDPAVVRHFAAAVTASAAATPAAMRQSSPITNSQTNRPRAFMRGN